MPAGSQVKFPENFFLLRGNHAPGQSRSQRLSWGQSPQLVSGCPFNVFLAMATGHPGWVPLFLASFKVNQPKKDALLSHSHWASESQSGFIRFGFAQLGPGMECLKGPGGPWHDRGKLFGAI